MNSHAVKGQLEELAGENLKARPPAFLCPEEGGFVW